MHVDFYVAVRVLVRILLFLIFARVDDARSQPAQFKISYEYLHLAPRSLVVYVALSTARTPTCMSTCACVGFYIDIEYSVLRRYTLDTYRCVYFLDAYGLYLLVWILRLTPIDRRAGTYNRVVLFLAVRVLLLLMDSDD